MLGNYLSSYWVGSSERPSIIGPDNRVGPLVMTLSEWWGSCSGKEAPLRRRRSAEHPNSLVLRCSRLCRALLLIIHKHLKWKIPAFIRHEIRLSNQVKVQREQQRYAPLCKSAHYAKESEYHKWLSIMSNSIPVHSRWLNSKLTICEDHMWEFMGRRRFK
jgi:hypothetical protein